MFDDYVKVNIRRMITEVYDPGDQSIYIHSMRTSQVYPHDEQLGGVECDGLKQRPLRQGLSNKIYLSY